MHTVRELVKKENKNPLRGGPVFSPIAFGEEAREMLAKQNLSADSVPAAGCMVTLHPKVSRLYGASTTEIAAADVHPDNMKMFEAIARNVGDPLFGVDIIMENMGRSWRDQPCGVIECNSLPAIDVHHDPLRGEARNVAGAVWNMIFPESGIRG
jgi:cyanophycin synthetase